VRPDDGAVDIDDHRAAELSEVTDRAALKHAVFRDRDDAIGDDEGPSSSSMVATFAPAAL
jgi:hypothetical protein